MCYLDAHDLCEDVSKRVKKMLSKPITPSHLIRQGSGWLLLVQNKIRTCKQCEVLFVIQQFFLFVCHPHNKTYTLLSSFQLIGFRRSLVVLECSLLLGPVIALGKRRFVFRIVLGLALQVYDARPDPGSTELIRVPDSIVDGVKRSLNSDRTIRVGTE